MPVIRNENGTVQDVRYDSNLTYVLCEHCDTRIERGTDYAVQLFLPEDTEKNNPIGPYCQRCMPELKVCSDCNKAYFGDDIKYFQNGIYYCTDCAATKDICHNCGETKDIQVYNGKKICTSCFDKLYFKCDKCGEMHSKVTDDTLSSILNKARYSDLYEKYSEICDKCFIIESKKYVPKSVKECVNCEEAHSNVGIYCNSCIQELPLCTFCGTQVHTYRDVQRKGVEVVVCSKCKYSVCEGCKNVTQGKLKIIKGIFYKKKLCSTCLTSESKSKECKKCLQFKKVNKAGLCSTCSSIYKQKCTSCGQISREPSSPCRACDNNLSGVYCYSYKPTPLFHYTERDGIEGDNIFMGFENEVVCYSTRTVLNKIYSKGLNHTKMSGKSDSTIHGNGFEMVSHPFTLRALKKEKKLGAMFVDVSTHKSCGMHIHVDRRAFKSEVHLFKVVSFIHDNKKFIDTLGGRSFTNYQRKLEVKPSSFIKNGKFNDRYQRVNLQNHATVEFRFFASVDKLYRFWVNIEFIHALISYTKDASIPSCKKFSGLIHYVALNKKKYNNLNRFLNAKLRYWN